MPVSARRAVALSLAGAALVASACNFDEAELVHPSDGVVETEVGQLRVLSYDVDPEGDGWIDVLSPDAAVVEEAGEYREDDGARLADDDEPGARRRLFTAVGSGRTLLVEINCGACAGGRPSAGPDETEVHIWEFAVDPAADAFTEDTSIALEGEVVERTVGEYVVVVRRADEGATPLIEVASDDGERFPLDLVAISDDADDTGRWVHVYLAARSGSGELTDPERDMRFPVRVSR